MKKSMLSSISRAGVGAVVATSLFLAGCEGDVKKVEDTSGVSCQSLIAGKEFTKALRIGRDAVKKNANDADAQYCVALASVGDLINRVNAIVDLVATLGAPQSGFQTSADVNLKGLVGSFVEPIQGAIREFDQAAYALSGMDNPTYHVDKFPLPLNVENILNLIGDQAPKVEGEAVFDLGGTWSLAEIQLLGAAGNAIQGILDYLLAHELIVQKLELPEISTQGLAAFLAKNTKLLTLTKNPADEARLGGNDIHKGVKNAVSAVLSFLVGRDADLEKVARKNPGAIAAIRFNAGLNANDKVLNFTVNADGYPTKVKIRMIDTLNQNATIKDADGEIIEIPSEFSVDIPKATWEGVQKFGKDFRDNIETKNPASLSLKPLLETIKAAVKDPEESGASRILGKEIPDLVYLNPNAILSKPMVIRDLIPNYATATTSYVKDAESVKVSHYDLGIEFETYDKVSNKYFAKRFGVEEEVNPEDNEFWHFFYSQPASYSVVSAAGVTVEVEELSVGEQNYTPLDDDDLTPSVTSPLFVYVSLQSPSFGGFLEVNEAAIAGGTAPTLAPADSASFNYGLNWLFQYFCLDFKNNENVLDAFDNKSEAYTGVTCPAN